MEKLCLVACNQCWNRCLSRCLFASLVSFAISVLGFGSILNSGRGYCAQG